jgi:hypothetical protein
MRRRLVGISTAVGSVVAKLLGETLQPGFQMVDTRLLRDQRIAELLQRVFLEGEFGFESFQVGLVIH